MKKNNRHGSVMLTVIFVFASLLILSTVIVATAKTENIGSIRQSYKTQAFYIARSGAEVAAKAIIDNDANAQTDLKNNQTVTTAGTIGDGTFSAAATWYPATKSVKIVSTSSLKGYTSSATLNLTERQFSQTIDHETARSIFGNALYNSSTAVLDVSRAYIEGPISGLGPIIAPPGYDPELVFPNTAKNLPQIIVPVLPEATPYNVTKGTLNISSSKKFGTISLMNDDLIIDTTAGDVDIVVDSMYLKNNLELRGSNKVRIFVLSDLTLMTKQIINNIEPKQLNIYLTNGSKCDLQSNTTVNAYIYGPQSEITMNSSTTILRGAIVGKVFNIGQQSILFVPVGVDDFNLSITDTSYTVIMTELKKSTWE